MQVERLTYVQPVVVVDGVPLCPCHSEPMVHRGEDQWGCAIWAPLVDLLTEGLAVFEKYFLDDQPQP